MYKIEDILDEKQNNKLTLKIKFKVLFFIAFPFYYIEHIKTFDTFNHIVSGCPTPSYIHSYKLTTR